MSCDKRAVVYCEAVARVVEVMNQRVDGMDGGRGTGCLGVSDSESANECG
jgi:hypothetical protein